MKAIWEYGDVIDRENKGKYKVSRTKQKIKENLISCGEEGKLSQTSCENGLLTEVGTGLLILMGWAFISTHYLTCCSLYGT